MKDKKLKLNPFIYEYEVAVCAHLVSFYFDCGRKITDEEKSLLNEAAEDRAKQLLIENYHQGELNYESDTLSCTGWWHI